MAADFVDAAGGAVEDLVDAVALSVEIVVPQVFDGLVVGVVVIGIAGGYLGMLAEVQFRADYRLTE